MKTLIKPILGAVAALAIALSAQAKEFRLGLITPPPHMWI